MISTGIILVLISVCLMIFLQGLKKITTDPPHSAVVTVFGKRMDKIRKEGWRFFFLYPFVRGFVEVNVKAKNTDFEPQTVRTPDFVELEIPISVTYTPDSRTLKKAQKEQKEKNPLFVSEFKQLPLIEYLNKGKEDGVNDILQDIIRERLRVWAIAHSEGPQSGEEAMKAQYDAVAILVKAIAGVTLTPIPSDIPTTILLSYFAKFRAEPTESEAKTWGPHWKKVEERLGKLTPEELQHLTEVVEGRREVIQALRQGNGVQPIPQLGIILNRLNIGEIKPLGEWAKALEMKSKEDRDRIAETVELEHVRDQIGELKTALTISSEQALEIIQTERGKVAKNISETKLNISEETRGMLKEMVSVVAEKFSKGGNN
ncbi:MAG TPA: hypothetical protein ENH26_00645 [Candidatus Wolfebacteria bacterium]|nr:hypothetical protein [Candidatus Wolfebacteria bacterium]